MEIKDKIKDISKIVTEKSTEIIDNISKKSDELIKISKIHLEIAKKEQEIKNIYLEIGEESYKAYLENSISSDNLEEKYEKIKKLNDEIFVLKEELHDKENEKKHVCTCGGCGGEHCGDDCKCSQDN